MRKWLAIFSLVGLASSILFGQMFEPLSPHDPIDDASAFLTIPWAKVSFAFLILLVYALLHLFSDRLTIAFAKCAVLIVLCLGLSVLLWVVLRYVRGFGGGPLSGFAAAVFVLYVIPIATLVVTILIGCPMLFFLAPSVGRKFMLAAACFMVLAYIGIAYLKHSTSGKLPPFYEIISTWMILTSGALWVLMRRPIVVEWSNKARGSRADKKRRNAGLCVDCGYNLHGLTKPRCPECGLGFEFKRPQSEA